MHIGIDCRLPTYQMGGISQYTIHLIQALGDLRGASHFRIFHSHREKRSFVPDHTMFSRSNLFTPCHHRSERLTLAAELFRYELDVFHSPDFIPPVAGAKRRIITVHDLTFLYYPEFLTPESRRYYLDQIGWAVRAANHIIADSEATRRDLISLLGVAANKVTTIYLAANPIHSHTFAQEDIENTVEALKVGRGFVLAVGTLEPRKNIPMLLNAYKQLRTKHHITTPLVLVGSRGWLDMEIFQTIGQLDLGDHVLHLSGLTDIQLAHLYRAAGVLAFPSFYEGFGLPALEAMHASCPVIVSNRGSLPEVVGNSAIMLDPDDVEGWISGLWHVLSDREYAQTLKTAGLIQAQQFSWAKTAAATAAVYAGNEV